MVNLLVGTKGTGKTKRLIEQANKAVESSKGYVAVVARGTELRFDISRKARLIDIKEYEISGIEALYGFISGICAGNYDVTDIFIDSTLKIIGNVDMQAFVDFVKKVDHVSSIAEVQVTFSVSADESVLPESLSEFKRV